MRTSLHLPWFAGVVLASFSPVDAFGECTPEYGETVIEEQNRIGDCLAERARTPDTHVHGGTLVEERLYTWGPPVKIDRMLRDEYFCDYEFARQREFELKKYAKYWSPATDRWYSPPFATGLRELSAVDVIASHKHRLSLLFVFEGFLPRGATLEQRLANIQADVARYEERPTSATKSKLAGRLAAHGQGAGTRPSSIKTGRGVYFGHDPFRYSDAAAGNVRGLVCDLPQTRAIVDLTDPATRTFLEDNQIIYSESIDLFGAQIVPFINNPRLFDASARGRFIIRASFPAIDQERPRDQVYVDKCAINYQTCRPISLSARSLSCEDFGRLAGIRRSGLDLVVDDRLPDAVRLESLFTEQENFRADFERRAAQCLGVTSTDTLITLLRQADRNVFADALN
ncbi:MAG: hypothetical protein QNJ14_17445 [Woeseiaceae bacterium]|nr:hypothetical protein [Woeseiaceae bacterium]